MPETEQITYNEHFIPKMYFRRFTNSTTGINRYAVDNVDFGPEWKSLNKICREYKLYELFDESGEIILPNMIENTFQRIEKKAGDAFISICKRAENGNCLNCTSFLSEEEKNYLVLFIVSLVYRDVHTIESGVEFLKETEPGITDREARNFTLMNLLPLWGNAERNEKTVIRTALENYENMAFQIGVYHDDVFFTSDRPVVQWGLNSSGADKRPREVIFPLSSRIVLYMYPTEHVEPNSRNCLFALDEERIKEIQFYVAGFAREYIYSRLPLTEAQINIVKEARRRLHETKQER